MKQLKHMMVNAIVFIVPIVAVGGAVIGGTIGYLAGRG